MMVLDPDVLGDDLKLYILTEMGKMAQSRYNQNLFFGSNYQNLRLLMNSLQFKPNLDEFDNDYWIDTGDPELNKIATYFEYGTGIFNTKGPKKLITAKGDKKMSFDGTKKFKGQTIFTDEVKGVKPVFMMTRAVESIRNERSAIEQKIISRLG